ncbi:unnamed protein product, partial [marine sediment metagenome]
LTDEALKYLEKNQDNSNDDEKRIAKVLINKLIGDKAILKRGQEDLVFEIIDIAYC